jgi:hypothetical protein
VFEILSVNEKIRDAILDPSIARDLTALAFENGMFSMEQDAFIKAMHKLIPYEEIAQVHSTLSVDMGDAGKEEEVDSDEDTEVVKESHESYQHDLV